MKQKKSLSVFKLINTYFFKNKVGLLFSVLFPLFFMLVFFIVGHYASGEKTPVMGMDTKNSSMGYFASGFPAFMTLTICPLSMLSLPTMNIEFRNSILLKKVKSSGISKYEYNGLTFGYFMLMTVCATLITLSIYFLFLIGNYDLIANFDWLTIIFGLFSLMIISITFAMFISSFIKSSFACQMINIAIILMSLALSGQFLPIYLVGKIDAIKYINLFSPLGYPQAAINVGTMEAFSGMMDGVLIKSSSSIFDWSSAFYYKYVTITPTLGSPEQTSMINLLADISIIPEKKEIGIKIYDVWQKVLDVFMPFILSGTFIFLSSYYFKWSNR